MTQPRPYLIIPLIGRGALAPRDADAQPPRLPHDGQCKLEAEGTVIMGQSTLEQGTTLLRKNSNSESSADTMGEPWHLWVSCGTHASEAPPPQCRKHTNPFPQLSLDPTVSLLTMDTAEGDSTTKQTGQPRTGTGSEDRDSVHTAAWLCHGAPFECNSISHWGVPGHRSVLCSDKDGTLSGILWMDTWLCCIDGNQHTTPKKPHLPCPDPLLPSAPAASGLQLSNPQVFYFLPPTSTYPIMPTANS